MNRFDYQRPTTVEQALRLGAGSGAAYVGGATTLLDLMKLGVMQPTLLIDVNDAGLRSIEWSADGSLRLGAAVTMAQAAEDVAIRKRMPLLHQALMAGATPQLRNAATMGGNILQRPRCFYFREAGFRCNKRVPGAGCDALYGADYSHAIFGDREQCLAIHPSDMATALVCLEAWVELRSRRGMRRVRLEEFLVAAGPVPTREATIEPGEMVTAIEVPNGSRFERAHYFKIPPAGGFAVVSAAVGLEINGGVVKSARVVMGGVAHKPWRAHFAEARVEGRAAGERTWREAAAAEMARASGRGGNDFKIGLGREVLFRALAMAANRKAA